MTDGARRAASILAISISIGSVVADADARVEGGIVEVVVEVPAVRLIGVDDVHAFATGAPMREASLHAMEFCGECTH